MYDMKQLKVVVIGAGNRGTAYTDNMRELPEQVKVVAVAEPIESRRRDIQQKHGIPDERCYNGWETLLSQPKMADIAIVSTMDRGHFAPAAKAIGLGYHLLLEKPVCPTPEECLQLEALAKKHGVVVVVCHVLRYTSFFGKLRELIDSGAVGEVVSVNHEECVGNVHQSHSFVRGNWGNEERSSCMLLQKSCHDMDILQWLLQKRCTKVQSLGGLYYFNAAHAPKGAPERCIDGCPSGDTCPYNAVRLYLEDHHDAQSEWFRTTCAREADPTDAMVEKALRTTQYGKCVFKCDNTVVDHQTVNLEFEGGTTATFTMNAFNKGGRSFHIMGTKGEIHADLSGEDTPILVYNFETQKTTEHTATGKDGITGGHGGGDVGILSALYHSVCGDYTGKALSDISVSVANHLIVFAAERSRKEGTVIDFNQYVNELKSKMNDCV